MYKNTDLQLGIFNHKKYLIAIIIIGFITKLTMLPIRLGDYNEFLEPWINFITANGYIKSLKYDFYNYTPAYIYFLIPIAKLGIYPLYAIKFISILFEYILAYIIGKIAFLKYKNSIVYWISFAIVPALPTLILNGSVLGQCDSIYSSFVVASIYFSLNKKRFLSVIFVGLAISFKLQTIFILPFYFVYMLKGNIKWYYFLSIPIIYFLSILPAWLYGRPLTDLLTIYISQSNYYKSLSTFFPSIYIWLNDDNYEVKKLFGLLFTTAFTLYFGVFLSKKKYNFTFEIWIKLAFLSAIIIPFILPGMRERYLYLGDVLAVLYFMISPKLYRISLGILLVSFYSYISCSRFKDFLPLWPAFILYSIVIYFAILDFVNSLNNSITSSTNEITK